MTKVVVPLVGLLVVVMSLPFVAAVLVTTGVLGAEAACPAVPGPAPADGNGLGDLGGIDGPAGVPVTGKLTFAQANIKQSGGLSALDASMPAVLSHRPDFVTLNEMAGRTLGQIQAAAGGYDAFRVPDSTGDANSMANVVLWRASTWEKVGGGRVQLVAGDKFFFNGEAVSWDRFAVWVMLRRADGAVVSVIATHQMINPVTSPAQHGDPPQSRAEMYGAGMDTLLRLRNSLAAHGPVLIGGDMNTHASYTSKPWSAAAKMRAAGYEWYTHSVDFLFYPAYQGVRLVAGWTGVMRSEHQWIAAELEMNSAGPETQDTTTGTTGSGPAGAVPGGEAARQLKRISLIPGGAPLTGEQVNNAVTISQVARDLGVPRYGLQVAYAAAIQESRLVNLPGGDRDSAGLFQQRPTQGWGSYAEVTNPVLAARAFFGRASHTHNTGLLDVPGWRSMTVAAAAQAVQRSGYPEAYARWEQAAGDIADILGPDLAGPDPGSQDGTGEVPTDCVPDRVNPITVATLNILGASQTATASQMPGYGRWGQRLDGEVAAIEAAGASIAGLQEVEGPQAGAFTERYGAKWGMYPGTEPNQSRVIWDRNVWEPGGTLPVPQPGGGPVMGSGLWLTGVAGGPYAGRRIVVWSVHHTAGNSDSAKKERASQLAAEKRFLDSAGTTGPLDGTPLVLLGDFADQADPASGDGPLASQCVLTPTLANAFGGGARPCRKPAGDAPGDHIYGAGLEWANARVDTSTQTGHVSDHPLVVATTSGSDTGCAVSTTTAADYHLGQVQPQLTALVGVLAPMFGIETVGGYRASATDPAGHPAGLAADFMTASKQQGDRLAAYAAGHAGQLGIDYVIWWQRIWSAARASEGWRPMPDRGSATENHKDHVHINVKPQGTVDTAGPPGAECGQVVYPVPAEYVNTDRHNWHQPGRNWESWHTGTDFSVPCGTPVYAAHAGTVEIDTSQPWAGPALVKITTGPESLATWYAHMEKVTVSRAERVQPGQQIGLAGQEGNATGCHLHFEVHLHNGGIYGADNVDPSKWLAENATPTT
jgi:endonuclease/exonuclease/phosphatase family metal-dependent hydrolase